MTFSYGDFFDEAFFKKHTGVRCAPWEQGFGELIKSVKRPGHQSNARRQESGRHSTEEIRGRSVNESSRGDKDQYRGRSQGRSGYDVAREILDFLKSREGLGRSQGFGHGTGGRNEKRRSRSPERSPERKLERKSEPKKVLS